MAWREKASLNRVYLQRVHWLTSAGVESDVVDIINAGAPTNGTSGTGVGVCGPGSCCRDYTNAKLYINTNTKSSPTWTVVGAQTT